MAANTSHPLPWRVEYNQRFEEWDEQSQPAIYDAEDKLVVAMPQNVDHPGLHDELAIHTAHQIVNSVNAAHNKLG